MPRISMLLSLLPLLATCEAYAETPRVLAVPGFSCNSGKYAVSVPHSLRKLRQIAKLEAEKRPRKDAGWENYRVLYFRDLEIGITINSQRDKYALEHVRITGSQWNIAGPFRVGTSATKALASLGETKPADGVWKLWEPGPEQALINIKAGLISEVSYSCYTG